MIPEVLLLKALDLRLINWVLTRGLVLVEVAEHNMTV